MNIYAIALAVAFQHLQVTLTSYVGGYKYTQSLQMHYSQGNYKVICIFSCFLRLCNIKVTEDSSGHAVYYIYIRNLLLKDTTF